METHPNQPIYSISNQIHNHNHIQQISLDGWGTEAKERDQSNGGDQRIYSTKRVENPILPKSRFVDVIPPAGCRNSHLHGRRQVQLQSPHSSLNSKESFPLSPSLSAVESENRESDELRGTSERRQDSHRNAGEEREETEEKRDFSLGFLDFGLFIYFGRSFQSNQLIIHEGCGKEQME